MDSPTSRPRKSSAATSLTVASLIMAAAGIVIQIASGAEYPTIPRGLLILLAAAGLVALATRWRWTIIIGVIVSLFLLVGGALAPQAREQLGDPTQVGVFIGTVIQLLALVVALVASVAATRQRYRTPDPDMTTKTAGGRLAGGRPAQTRLGARAASLLAATRQVLASPSSTGRLAGSLS
jgi:type VI protein secretion system component VasK